MFSFLKALFADKHGVTAIEYGLVAVFLAILIVAGARGIGTGLSTIYGTVSSSL